MLSFCVLWGTIVLFGPTFISFGASKIYGDRLAFYGLKVSPKLKISAARVVFKNFMFGELALHGSMRAPSLKLNYFVLNRPSFRIAALDLNTNLAQFSNLEADISLAETSFFGNYNFEVIANDLTLPAFGFADRVSIAGAFNSRNARISNTKINANNLLVNSNSDIKNTIYVIFF